MKFKYGFYEGDILYGWRKEHPDGWHPYRLPQMIGNRFYPLKKVGVYKARNLFYIAKKLRSFDQLKSKTIVINQEVNIIEDINVPF